MIQTFGKSQNQTQKTSKEELIRQISNLGITIKKIENNEVACLCPKHNDSSPSFFFNLESEAFHCFVGCMKGRGIHQLIFQLTGISQAGIPTNEIILHKFNENREKDKKKLPSIPYLPLAVNNIGEEYLLSRGILRKTITKWSLRYWAEENAIVIPLDHIGYACRYLDKNAPRKYKYISGTRITDTLFGIQFLPKTLTNIIIVEGSLDAIFLHQLGFENTLALLHADISRNQIKLLEGISNFVYLLLDGDAAGRRASFNIKKLLSSYFITKICSLPEGKDPDNLTKVEIEKVLRGAK